MLSAIFFTCFWLFTATLIIKWCHLTGSNVLASVVIGILITFALIIFISALGNGWAAVSEIHWRDVGDVYETTAQKVITPDGREIMVIVTDTAWERQSVMASQAKRVIPANHITEEFVDKDTKFYIITTRPRFSGIAFIESDVRVQSVPPIGYEP